MFYSILLTHSNSIFFQVSNNHNLNSLCIAFIAKEETCILLVAILRKQYVYSRE